MSWPSTAKSPEIAAEDDPAGNDPAEDDPAGDPAPEASARGLGGAVPEHPAATIAATTANHRNLIDLPPLFTHHGVRAGGIVHR